MAEDLAKAEVRSSTEASSSGRAHQPDESRQRASEANGQTLVHWLVATRMERVRRLQMTVGSKLGGEWRVVQGRQRGSTKSSASIEPGEQMVQQITDANAMGRVKGRSAMIALCGKIEVATS